MEPVVLVLVEVERDVVALEEPLVDEPPLGVLEPRTGAFSAIHSESFRSPSEDVRRAPLPTRRSSIRSVSRSREPSVRRSVEPSALPLSW
jgi:hypothetical protein